MTTRHLVVGPSIPRGRPGRGQLPTFANSDQTFSNAGNELTSVALRLTCTGRGGERDVDGPAGPDVEPLELRGVSPIYDPLTDRQLRRLLLRPNPVRKNDLNWRSQTLEIGCDHLTAFDANDSCRVGLRDAPRARPLRSPRALHDGAVAVRKDHAPRFGCWSK